MALEDFTTFVEADPSGYLTVAAHSITWANLPRNAAFTTRAYKNYGVGYFGGDFIHTMKFTTPGGAHYQNGAWAYIYWMVRADQAPPNQTSPAGLETPTQENRDYIGVFFLVTTGGLFQFYLRLCEDGVASSDISVNLLPETTYFLRIVRDDDGGVNGTGRITVVITTVNYYGEPGADPVDTITLDCAVGEQNDFDFLFVTIPRASSGVGYTMDGVVEDLDLHTAQTVYVDFTVAGTGTLNVPVIASTPSEAEDDGSQPAIVYRPEVPVVEHLGFLTTINRSIGGVEERIALRKVPRKVFEFRIAEGRQHLESLLYTRAARKLTLPHWHEPAYLTTAAVAGDTHVHVGTTALSEFRAGGFALVWRSETRHDAMLIASVTTTQITFDTGNVLTHDYSVGTQVLPLDSAYAQDIAIDRQNDSAVYDMKFEMVPQDSDLGLTPYYDGELVLSEVNYCDGNLRESIAQRIYTVDSPQGGFDKTTIRANSDRGMVLGFRTHDRTELWALRELLYKLQGRKTSFYLVTFAKDLVPVAALTNGLTRLDVEYCGYTPHVAAERDIRVVLTDGTVVSRTIKAWNVLSSTKERLTVDEAWPSTVQVADVDRIEYRDLVRLDTDDVVIEHYNAIGSARCEVPVVRVYPPPIETGNPIGLLLGLTYQE